MPYKSDAQRRFFHTDTAKKAGITSSDVEEFDKASKGKKLPEKVQHKSDGGEVAPELKDDKFTEGVKEGFHNGIQADWEALKAKLSEAGRQIHDFSTETKSRNPEDYEPGTVLPKDEPVHMADGGDTTNPLIGAAQLGMQGLQGIANYGKANPDVARQLISMSGIPGISDIAGMAPSLPGANTPPPTPNFQPINPQAGLPPPAPMNPMKGAPTGAPGLSQAVRTMQQGPSTSPNIYQGMTAEDRAALMQKLLAQKASPGMMAASGVAGLGDAITGAFGKNPTNAQGNLRQAQQQNVEQRIGVMDTERQQKIQDLTANIAMQKADPNSAFSTGFRNFLKSQGIQVPSGMSAAMLEPMFTDIAKMFETRTVAATAAGNQGIEAGKALMGETWGDWLRSALGGAPEKGETYLESRVGSKPSVGNTGGWKVVR